jgi:Cu-Zn family superoxide dismutase
MYILLLLVAAGCAQSEAEVMTSPSETTTVTQARARLNPVKGSSVKGEVVFMKVPKGMKVIAHVEGLKPGQHGFHIHEYGNCGGEAASAAGAHFNPTHHQHGGPDSAERHVGDLGNLVADKNGVAHYEIVDSVLTFEGEQSIIGRSVIVHEYADDYKTQPTGASGGRISCGIIEIVNN